MIIATWIVAGSLAVLNFFAGAVKAFTPWPRLQEMMPWTETTGKGPTYVAAWAEIIGAIGVLLPLLLARSLEGWGWAVWVSLAAVIGLSLIQLLAIGVHVKRREVNALRTNITLLILGVTAATLLITLT